MGAGWAQFSLLVTGAIGASLLGFDQHVSPARGGVAALVLLTALCWYEWSRRTIRACHFHIAWSGDVPDSVCDKGPYAFVRHPVYTSYVLAFLAVPIAFPRWETVAIFLFNSALYLHAALDDERSLTRSPLQDAYAAYRKRTGMFLPRLSGSLRGAKRIG